MSDRAVYERMADLLRARQAPPAPAGFAGDDKKVAAAIAVYRNNVRAGLSKALGEKFPVVRALVGEDFFKFTANEYFNVAPPSSPLVSEYGATFPEFLDGFEPARNLPYLGDMARLEIAWLESYRAVDAAPLSAEDIIGAAGEDPSSLRFTMHPALRLRRSRFAIGSIWRRHKEGGEGERISAGNSECVMIVRPHRDVHLEVIGSGVFAALEKMAAGAAVAEAFEAASGEDAAFDPQAAFRLLFESGAAVAIEHNRENGQ